MNNQFNYIDSKAGLIERTGPAGNNYHDDFSPAVAYLHERLGKETDYDLSYDGPRDNFVHTPIFNNMLLIRTADNKFNTHLVNLIKEKDREVTLNLKPKYVQIPYTKSIDELFILPGSNLLHALDDDFREHISHRVTFKMHPVTTRLDKFLWKKNSNCLDAFLSGIDCIKNADVVWSADSSELGLIAKYLGKEVKRYYLKNYAGTYQSLYDSLDNVDIWLNSSKSGIIRMTHYKEDIDAYLKHHSNHYNDKCELY